MHKIMKCEQKDIMKENELKSEKIRGKATEENKNGKSRLYNIQK